MRFGIKLSQQNTQWSDILDVFTEADQIELFESGWNFDHFEPIFSDRSGPCLEGWSMLAALAARTERIRLGCQVSGMIYRHPALLANIAATIDIISNGRLIVGLGAGWNADECAALGIDLPPLRERFDRFEEGIEVIVALLTERQSNFEGTYFRLANAYCEPKPSQRPHPPIAIGGNGERRTLAIAARWAQHWNSTLPDVEQWCHKRDVLWRHCQSIGRDPRQIELSANIRVSPGTTAADVVSQASAWRDAGVDLCLLALIPPHSPGVLRPLADALGELA